MRICICKFVHTYIYIYIYIYIHIYIDAPGRLCQPSAASLSLSLSLYLSLSLPLSLSLSLSLSLEQRSHQCLFFSWRQKPSISPSNNASFVQTTLVNSRYESAALSECLSMRRHLCALSSARRSIFPQVDSRHSSRIVLEPIRKVNRA
jgi:hypothetical protein